MVVSDGKCNVLELGPAAIDRPPSARGHVHHRFNIRTGKIDEVEKRTNIAPILGRLLDNGGLQRHVLNTIGWRKD